MAAETFELSISVAWWVSPYMHAVRLFCVTFGTESDIERIVDFILRRGVRVKCKNPPN